MTRIKALASLAKDFHFVADIGCDHGLVLYELLKLNKDVKCLAVDNKKGPLDSARKLLSSYQNVSFSLSNGIENLPENVDCVIVAGLGGSTIKAIFENHDFSKISRFIINPSKNPEIVRLFLTKNGLKIVSEEVIYEKGTYYQIIVFERGKGELTELETKYGPVLLKNRSEMFLKMYRDLIKRLPEFKAIKIREELKI